MGGRGASSMKNNHDRFVNKLIKEAAAMPRGDLQGVVEAYAMSNGLDSNWENAALEKIDNAQYGTENKTNSAEINAVYEYANKRAGGRIGANTKAYEYALKNATDIRIYDRFMGEMGRTTRARMLEDVKRFGKGKHGFEMWKSGENQFTLHYSTSDFYTFKLKR